MAKKNRKHHRQQVYQVPSNTELDSIKTNQNLSEIVKQDMITLHKINKQTKTFVMDAVQRFVDGVNMVDTETKGLVVKHINVMTPHTLEPGNFEYIQGEVNGMIQDCGDDLEEDTTQCPLVSTAYIMYMTGTSTTGDEPVNWMYVDIVAQPVPTDGVIPDSFTWSRLYRE